MACSSSNALSELLTLLGVTFPPRRQNELAVLEFIHCFVEVLDKHFGQVCELDIMNEPDMVGCWLCDGMVRHMHVCLCVCVSSFLFVRVGGWTGVGGWG